MAEAAAEKPRFRVPAARAADSYQNFMASVGNQTRHVHSGSTYGFLPLTRERTLLEWVYRGSWICGVAVDAVADDATRMGIDWSGQLPPDDGEKLEAAFTTLDIWGALNELWKWSRLYGGAVAIMLIDGQNPSTPLRTATISPGQFRGLMVLDRWMVQPTLNQLVTDFGPDLGKPVFYQITADAPAYKGLQVHYSRVIRMEGVHLPWWQSVTENSWGMSVVERIWDRLTAFDSTTQGVVQLVYRAYLRIVKMKYFKEMAAQSDQQQQGFAKRLQLMTQWQINEGITVIDAEDDFQSIAYSFAGLDTVLEQIGQQLAGALQIPLVRLFGQAPAGLNATGESDWRNYYDGVAQEQEKRLRRPLMRVIKAVAASERIRLEDTFSFLFRPLWQLLPKEKAELGETVTRTVLSAEELGLISEKRALEELRASARETGIWASLTDEEIDNAAEEPAPAAGGLPGGVGGATEAAGGAVGGGPGAPQEPGQRQLGGAPAGRPQHATNPVPLPRVSLGRGNSQAA